MSLTESMRKDPDKYSSLIYHNNTSSNADYNSQNYETASYGQQQQIPITGLHRYANRGSGETV